MAFEGLSEKLNATFKRLRGKGRLTEADVREGMREVRLALLEADVSYKVVGADGRHQRPVDHRLQGAHRCDDGGLAGRR